MEKKNLRAPAVPLVTHDPMFSVWSFASNLTDDVTRHWDGVREYMFGLLAFDGELFEFMGKTNADDCHYISFFPALTQTGCEVRPMTTKYTFENEKLAMELTFTSPLLLNDLMVLSRPVTYIDYKITPKDGGEHDIHIYFGFSSEFCVHDGRQSVTLNSTHYSITLSSGTENMFKRSGDDLRIEWGTLHVVSPDYLQTCMSLRAFQRKIQQEYCRTPFPINRIASQGCGLECMGPEEYAYEETMQVYPDYPTIVVRKQIHTAGEAITGELALAYDDIKCIQYFGQNVDAYWKKDGDSFNQMLKKALKEKQEVLKKVYDFEEELLAKARKISDKYADIISLAYRQTIAGHKLAWHDGKILFVSKENYSNGCAATVDVTYPSLPLFLIYAPQLVEGMLNPIFRMIDEGLWDFEFAPHDAGRYPMLNGQMYGYRPAVRNKRLAIEGQMPVEECGNMILCVAALCFAKKDMSYFQEHKDLLKQWADYLVKVGHNPDNQLCTDDFAGRMAHNTNLSAKGICALGAIAKLFKEVGEKDAASYYDSVAKEYAKLWEKDAERENCYALTFDSEDTWSLKYNMVWDKLFDMKLFSQKVYDKELAWYKTQVRPYGIPLDIRSDYTKSDWQMWSTRLFDDAEYTDMIVNTMWDFLNESPDRVPFSDWYYVSKPYIREFQARTVQGGLFINLLNF